MLAMITQTKPKNALVLTTSPVLSSIITSFMKMMRACSAQRMGRGATTRGGGEGPPTAVAGAEPGAGADIGPYPSRASEIRGPVSRPAVAKSWPGSSHMKERRIEHTYDCSAEVFWNQLFLDDEYNRKLFVDELHFSTWRVIRLEERGGE